MKRRIAAIMAADVVGYSRMISDDEEETLRRLLSYREVFSDFVGRGGGRIFNTAGDAVFAEFPSAVEGLRAAIEIQESIRTRNLAFPESRHMRFRIGMTIGDVVERDGDLLGDGVNIAARLEGLAEPGGICISRSVHEQVGSKISVAFRDIGPQSVKNIPIPVHAFTIPATRMREDLDEVRPRARRGWIMAAVLVGACVLAALASGLIVANRDTIGRRPMTSVPAIAGPAGTPEPVKDVARAPAPAPVAANEPVAPATTVPPPDPAPAAPLPTLVQGTSAPPVQVTARLAGTEADAPATSPPPDPSRPRMAAADDASTLVHGTSGTPSPGPVRLGSTTFDASEVPFLGGDIRLRIAADLSGNPDKALAISTRGSAGWTWNKATEDDARTAALKTCRDQNNGPCKLFAVNDAVTWPDFFPPLPPEPWVDDVVPRTPFDAHRLAGIGDEDRAKLFADYPAGKLHKALAMGFGHWSYVSDETSLLEAERLSLEHCWASAGGTCRVVAADDEFVVAPGEPPTSPEQPQTYYSTATARVAACDTAAAAPFDALRPRDVPGVNLASIEVYTALPACEAGVAASPDNARVLFELGRAYLTAGKQDKAREFFDRAASGDAEALNSIGYMYDRGLGMPVDTTQAIAWFRRAVDAGSVGALLNLGMSWNQGRGVPHDPYMAFVLWGRAVDAESSEGMYLLGKLLYAGADGVDRNPVRASVLFQIAAEAGHADAAEELGRMYEVGDVVEQNKNLALSWYSRAFAGGNAQAASDVSRLAPSAN